jgi:DivIVA domain-containing protein
LFVNVYVYVVAWALIGLGTLHAAPSVIKLTIGRARPLMTEPGAWSEAWRDLRQSLVAVASGLNLLGIAESRADPLWRLAGVPIVAFGGWFLASWLRSRMRGKPDGERGEGASRPGTSGGGERRHPRTQLPLPAEGASAEEVAEWVDRKIFSTTRLRPGYDEEEVDVFLDAIRDSFLGVRGTLLTSDEIRNIKFTKTRLRPGYDEDGVDTFLDHVGTRLAT